MVTAFDSFQPVTIIGWIYLKFIDFLHLVYDNDMSLKQQQQQQKTKTKQNKTKQKKKKNVVPLFT